MSSQNPIVVAQTVSPLTADWPDPNPIIGKLKPVPFFDPEALLPMPFRTWVMDEADRMPVPPDYIAVASLVALGSVIGAKCAIRPKANDSWEVVPNTWGGFVGPPSSKKTPAMNAALKPLHQLATKASEKFKEEMSEFEMAKFMHDVRKEGIEKRIKDAATKPGKGDPDSIAMELRAHALQAPTPPTLQRYKTNDSTIEKLGEILCGNPHGLLIERDELTGLLSSWDREGREGDRAFFLEAWNGNQGFDTDRIGRGHIAIPNLCLSIIGGIQPDKLISYLEQATHSLGNDGMLQRFQLLIYPDPIQWEWRDRRPNHVARDLAFSIFESLAEFEPEAWGAAPPDEFGRFPHFHFDQAAQEVFIAWSTDMHTVRLPQEKQPIIEQHLSKFDKLFPALALIFHLVDCAANGVRGPVTVEDARRAWVWCEYLEAHARRCYGLLTDDGLRAAKALADKVKGGELPNGFTMRDVRRHQWSGLTNDEDIQPALEWLEDEHWLRPEITGGTGPGSGRRTVRYRIHPKILEKRRFEAA